MALRISDWYTPINYPVMPPTQQKGIGDALLEIAKINQEKRANRRQDEEMALRKQESEERRKSLELERQAREMDLAEKRKRQELEQQLPGVMDEMFANSAAVDPNDPNSGAPSMEMLRYDALMKQGRIDEAEKLKQGVLNQVNTMGGGKTAAGRALFNSTMARSANDEIMPDDEVKEIDHGDGTATILRHKADGTTTTEVVGTLRPIMSKDSYGGLRKYDPTTGKRETIFDPVRIPGTGGGGGGAGAVSGELKKLMADQKRAREVFNGFQNQIKTLMTGKLKLDPAFQADQIAAYDAQIQEIQGDPLFVAARASLAGGQFPADSAGAGASSEGNPGQPQGANPPKKKFSVGKYLVTPPAQESSSPIPTQPASPAMSVSDVYAPIISRAKQQAKRSGRSF